MADATAPSPARARRPGAWRGGPWSWSLLPVGAALALFALPLVYLVWEASAVGAAASADLLFRPFVAGLLGNTLLLAMGVTGGAVVLGAGAAWIVERGDVPGRMIWRVLVPLPLAIPALVSAFAWLSLTPRVEGMGGAMGVLLLAEYPLVYIPAAAALRGLDPACEDVARSLGHGPWRIAARTILPQLLPAIGAGALLVCLHMFVEFGPLALLRVETFTTAIYEAYELAYDGAAAALLSGVLALMCLVVLALEMRLRRGRRFASLGAGAARPPTPVPLGRLRWPAAILLGALLALALGVPVAMLAYWIVLAHGNTAPVAAILAATLDSLRLSGAGALVTAAAGLALALAALRQRGRAAALAERLPLLVHALPGLVVALSLVFVSLRLAPALYQTTGLLILAYALLYLPLAQAGIGPALAQVPPAMREVALACGRPPWRVALTVTLPNILPGLGAAVLLVFLQLMKDLTATLVLAPTGVRTLAMELWAQSSQMKYGVAAPYAVLLVLVSGLPAYLATAGWLARRGALVRAGRLRIAGLEKSFGASRVLDGVDLDLAPGAITALLGASGCGKTTLLRLIAGFEPPDAGSVALDGRVLAGDAWVPAHRRGIGYVPQNGMVFPHLTVAGNVGFGLERGPARAARVARLLDLVGMAGLGARMPHQLSGGQQQRVALARALAPAPALILLDEPFNALDAPLRRALCGEVRAVIKTSGTAALLVTHDRDEAFRMADTVAVMQAGRIVQSGAPAALYAAPVSLEAARLTGPANIIEATVAGNRAICSLGAVPLANAAAVPDGPAHLMLRPEQIVAAEPGRGTPARLRGTATLGPLTWLTLAIGAAPDLRVSLTACWLLPAPPAPDAALHVAVAGAGMAFPLAAGGGRGARKTL